MHCPTCRLALAAPPTCRRCGTCLTTLAQIIEAHDQLLIRAYTAIAAGSTERAQALARRAAALCASRGAAEVLTLAGICEQPARGAAERAFVSGPAVS